MRITAALLLVTLTLPLLAADSPAPAEVELQSIFNGKDLTGWKVPKDNIWWTVDDGMLISQNDPKKKGSTLWTEKTYKDFVVECEFRFKGSIDSGVFLRTSKQQVQIGDSGSLKRDMTGSVYVPGKGYPKDAQGIKHLKPQGEWNHMRIEARGPEYRIWINGAHVLTFHSDKAPAEGPIGLQLHPNKQMRIDFRNLRAGDLK
ncbi:DUF1080 domain-containing protein [Planctomycetales bacterium ZRK34]|nr:DUF1080 domain-containing protein [Planctomycetales bacterium ZRK34]